MTPVEAPVRTPVKTAPNPSPDPDRILNPDRLCPSQKREVTRRVREE